MSSAPEVSVYDRMCWPEAELERSLALGAHRLELAAYLGGCEYAMLAALARQAMARRATVRQRPAHRRRLKVYLLPGILGSQLGVPRSAGQPPDLLWIDPADIVHGRLTELRLPSRRFPPRRSPPAAAAAAAGKSSLSERRPLAVRPLGAIVYSYLALKLRLAAAGFDVVLYDYDWRGDVLATGRALADRLAADDAEELALIGHSMGALVARAAIASYGNRAGAERITRLIGLGAPHGGSIAAVQALRASYPIVGRLAAIDRIHDAESLTRLAFRSFVSLYQLLPTTSASVSASASARATASASPALDLFDPRVWPLTGARPHPELLRGARYFGSRLALPDARFVSIVGTGQRTVTGIERRGQQFRYQVSSAGDGTVPCARATLPGVPSYSLRCDHGELPRSQDVAAALVDLLLRGRTRRLRAGVSARHGRSSFVTDSALRRELGRKIDWYGLSIGERRQYLDRLNAPPASYRAPQIVR
jgi:pimeloyl-ACP methyl ester carboxylesterase